MVGRGGGDRMYSQTCFQGVASNTVGPKGSPGNAGKTVNVPVLFPRLTRRLRIQNPRHGWQVDARTTWHSTIVAGVTFERLPARVALGFGVLPVFLEPGFYPPAKC